MAEVRLFISKEICRLFPSFCSSFFRPPNYRRAILTLIRRPRDYSWITKDARDMENRRYWVSPPKIPRLAVRSGAERWNPGSLSLSLARVWIREGNKRSCVRLFFPFLSINQSRGLTRRLSFRFHVNKCGKEEKERERDSACVRVWRMSGKKIWRCFCCIILVFLCHNRGVEARLWQKK